MSDEQGSRQESEGIRRARKSAELWTEYADRRAADPEFDAECSKHENEAEFAERLHQTAKAKVSGPSPGSVKRFRSRADDRLVPDPRWLVEGLIPENSDVAIYAPFAALKTFVAIDL